MVYKRNPYYFAIDPEGNQLPYMDERHVVITGSKVVSELRAMNGDVSLYETNVVNYVLAKPPLPGLPTLSPDIPR